MALTMHAWQILRAMLAGRLTVCTRNADQGDGGGPAEQPGQPARAHGQRDPEGLQTPAEAYERELRLPIYAHHGTEDHLADVQVRIYS